MYQEMHMWEEAIEVAEAKVNDHVMCCDLVKKKEHCIVFGITCRNEKKNKFVCPDLK